MADDISTYVNNWLLVKGNNGNQIRRREQLNINNYRVTSLEIFKTCTGKKNKNRLKTS